MLLLNRQFGETAAGYEEYVNDGPCGFAYVHIKPATSKFARWMKKENHARRDHYLGGLTMSVSDYNQSMQKKEVHAAKFAEVLRSHGIRATSSSRMD